MGLASKLMHDTSFETMRTFVRVHLGAARGAQLEVLDFGSQVVDEQGRSYRELFDDPSWHYRGLDIVAGHNVDVAVDDPYAWDAIPADSIDVVVSGQAFEHVEYFWASMFEIVRVLKPGGLATIIAPAGGFEHRYPVDCWRFYPDGARAIAGYVGCEVVDVFTDWQHGEWDDTILVARKPEWDLDGRLRFAGRALMQRRILHPGSGEHEAELPRPDIVAEPSILRTAEPGALTASLERLRDARVARAELAEEEARAAAAAEAQRIDDEREAAIEARIAAEAERIASERLESMTPVRVYGDVRKKVSDLVGDDNREKYKRWRGRT